MVGDSYTTLTDVTRAAAGFVNGTVAGAASHYVLDAWTPRGLPLIA
jgi:hypothetical protein